jgi:hypothetical protein
MCPGIFTTVLVLGQENLKKRTRGFFVTECPVPGCPVIECPDEKPNVKCLKIYYIFIE